MYERQDPVPQPGIVLDGGAGAPADGDRLGDTADRSTWTVTFLDGDPISRRTRESLLTVANGHVGTRGTTTEDGPGFEPLVMASGVYASDPGDVPRPLAAPLWFLLGTTLGQPMPRRRTLDLHRGLLLSEPIQGEGPRSTRFASIAQPTLVVQRTVAETLPGRASAAPLTTVRHDQVVASGWEGDVQWVSVGGHGGITVAASTDVRGTEDGWVIDRIAVVHRDQRTTPPHGPALVELAAARADGIDTLMAAHAEGWARRWDDAAVAIDGDPELELGVRFGLFQLLACAPEVGEAAVGARGLTGPGYAGHVFWDADVFVLPFLAATRPAAARAMLEYRIRRLEPARQRARAESRDGARFPWESAHDGTETTPTSVELPGGEVWPVLTGEQELHIVADVAWAAWQYRCWTGDDSFVDGDGGLLIVEAARYWVSRVELDPDGSGHIRGVIGPDEYHESVDDNVFTNVMARWCIRLGASIVDRGRLLDTDDVDTDEWRRHADALVDGHDLVAGRHEQFTGYDDLEPLLAADVAEPPFAADVLLGPDRTSGSQLIKQPDVVMAHHLVPGELDPSSFESDLDHYLPRTTHGSSLSPAIHSSVLARAGRPEHAAALLRTAALLDLDDVTGTTAGGLHVATMGGVWQALVFGFLGIRPHVEGLVVEPGQLPAAWGRLQVRLLFRGERIGVRHDGATVLVDAPDTVPLVLPGQAAPRFGDAHLVATDDGWEVVP